MTAKKKVSVKANVKAKVKAFTPSQRQTILRMVKTGEKVADKRGKLVGGQQGIALKVGTRKENIAYFLKQEKTGKRRTKKQSAFWKDVKDLKRIKGISHKQATKEVKGAKKWAGKRKRKSRAKKERELMKAASREDIDVSMLRDELIAKVCKRGWWLFWEVLMCEHSPPCKEGEFSWWEIRWQYLSPNKEDVPNLELQERAIEIWYQGKGEYAAPIRNFGAAWAEGRPCKGGVPI